MTISLDAAPVAFLLADGTDGTAGSRGRELRHCWQAVLARRGAPVLVGAIRPSELTSDRGAADVQLPGALPGAYCGLVLIRASGGRGERAGREAERFIRGFFALGLPVAASSWATLDLAWLDLVRARTLAAPPPVRPQLATAGAVLADRSVARCEVGPNVLITSAAEADLPDFCAAFTRAFSDCLAARLAPAPGS